MRQGAAKHLSPDNLEAAKKAVTSIPWLKLRPGESDVLSRRGRIKQYARYSTITRGTPDRTFCLHVICSGRVQTEHVVTRAVATRGPGDTCGEGALVTGIALWPEHAVAIEDCTLLQFSLADLEGVPLDMPMLRRETLATYIERAYYFRDLRHDQRCAVGATASFRSYSADYVLFAPGQPADKFYILIEGRVAVHPPARRGRRGGTPTSASGAGADDDDDEHHEDGEHEGARRSAHCDEAAARTFLEFKGGSDLSRGDITPPWFGLASVWDKAARTDAAVVLDEGTQMLEVPASAVFGPGGLQAMLPGFVDLARAEASSYRIFENQEANTPKAARRAKSKS